ncbi:GntR family transcriptional regulator [Actinacidiphila acididurans]|uniref:GntR family transcriptional regulator n=1 Tax=Actinacidiphila acididurans TaxID=2784346 RepID=A0ABS2TPF1_9ACTN|nr:GntR family transcriptional regulator [Actinacidiphila acididurans]MBM9504125.1 GntR family transcriptional regulator [Actinacidiphila acididurans]
MTGMGGREQPGPGPAANAEPRRAWGSPREPGAPLTAGEREILRVLRRSQEISGVTDEILIAVGSGIVEGRLKPGDDLNSVELARRFSSSRTPVREALLTLEREGLVEIAARKRPRVKHLGLTEVREMYELRSELYGLVSRRIVALCAPEQIAVFHDIQTRLEEAAAARDQERYFWLIVEFRNTEARLAGNETVRNVLDSVGIRTLQLRHLSLSLPGRLDTSVDDHRRLVRAYVDAEGELAAALTQSIVRRGLAAVERSGWTGSPG